jgi:hypothetical protein
MKSFKEREEIRDVGYEDCGVRLYHTDGECPDFPVKCENCEEFTGPNALTPLECHEKNYPCEDALADPTPEDPCIFMIEGKCFALAL